MWTLDIENIAGIRSGTATFQPGVNAVEASNWQGKSSLVAAVGTALGTNGELTAGADGGGVTLDAADGRYETRLIRESGTVVTEGEPYLTDERDRVRTELFAVLDGDNPVRRAVRDGENLEDVLTEPLDWEGIDERITDLKSERQRVERELERAEEAAADRPGVQERVSQLESELADLRTEREALAAEADGQDGAEGRRADLSEKVAARDRARSTVERLERQIDQLEDRLDERRAELDDLDVPEATDVEEELAARRTELDDIETRIDFLRTVYNANRRVLEDEEGALVAEIERAIDGDELTCWVCGETTGVDAVEERLDGLGDRIGDLRTEANELEDAVDDLEERRRAARRKRRRREELEEECRDLESRLNERRSDLTAARDRLDDLEAEVECLESGVRDLDDRLTDIDGEIKYHEAELEDAREELSELDALADKREGIGARRDEISAEIEQLRTRRKRIKRETRQTFDEAVREVVEAFDPSFETARLTAGFELVVARDGREVGIDALSEGEVELLGIATAVAGFETFDVADCVPVILLDGVGGLSAENLQLLAEYLRGRTEYVVTTAYPEQDSPDWNTVSPREWTVVSDPEPTA